MKHFLCTYILILILFIHDDDDSTNIEDIHISNVKSNVIVRDNTDVDKDKGLRGFHLKLWICSFKDVILLLLYLFFGILNVNMLVSVVKTREKI